MRAWGAVSVSLPLLAELRAVVLAVWEERFAVRLSLHVLVETVVAGVLTALFVTPTWSLVCLRANNRSFGRMASIAARRA